MRCLFFYFTFLNPLNDSLPVGLDTLYLPIGVV
jgi:hypothetical protein